MQLTLIWLHLADSYPTLVARTMALFSIAIAAAEVGVGLSLIIIAYRMYHNIDIADFRSLKG